MDVFRNQGRWWALTGDEMASAAYSTASKLQEDQDMRQRRANLCLSAYEGSESSTVHGQVYSRNNDLPEYELNLTRAACDTVHAEIAGRQKPMAKFQTTDGDWAVKRRAKKLERFVERVIKQKHGDFLTGWALLETCFHDSTIFPDGGTAKVFVDEDSGRIHLERNYSFELFVDPSEAKYGAPKNLFHMYTMDIDTALWTFAENPELDISSEKKAELQSAILASAGKFDENTKRYLDGKDQVQICEAWRLPFGEGSPGKHIFTCQAGVLLHEEEWDRDRFPFATIIWQRDKFGIYGKSLAWQGLAMHDEIVQYSKKMAERFALCGAKRTYYIEGTIDEADLESNEAESFVPVKPPGEIPRETVPQPIAEAEMRWMEFVINRYFQDLGVSEAKASARKEPGVTAGVAIRTVNDMQSTRFLPKAKAYENLYVEVAQLIIQCAREAEAAGIDTQAGDDDPIKWSEVALPEDSYYIEVAAASSLPNDPAGRLQMTQELYSAGVIGVETYKQLLGWPDLEKTMNFVTAQRNYLEKTFDKFLDIQPDSIDSATYEAPDPLLINKQDALLQASQAYFDALYDGAPQENLNLIRNWVTDLTDMLAKAQAEMEAAQAPMQGPAGPGEPQARMGTAGPEAAMPPPQPGM